MWTRAYSDDAQPTASTSPQTSQPRPEQRPLDPIQSAISLLSAKSLSCLTLPRTSRTIVSKFTVAGRRPGELEDRGTTLPPRYGSLAGNSALRRIYENSRISGEGTLGTGWCSGGAGDSGVE
ncbi:MAG: hypothetical protein RMJ19_14345, partial [Gemmatales bacterium]|nr:hypothetical protein [Gemmatales bacterium]MDW8176851.1 hypothetical protein [Gemmatales bacterium]